MGKRKLVLTRKVLAVALRKDARSGGDIYNLDGFKPNKPYNVYGAVWYQYADRSGDVCWLVENEDGVVVPRVMKNFRIVRAEP